MKRFLLGLLCVMSLCGCVQAANPSFSSFATNHFITNNFIIRARLNPLQFDTNSWTITITNVAGASTNSLWFNDLGNYIPTTLQNQLTATNIIGNERLQAAGSFILKALMGYTLGAGLNDVSALTNSVLWITGFDSDPANSSLRLDSGNGQGQLMVIQNFADNSGFTMRNGEALFNSAPNSYQILNGDWVSSHKGDCLLLYNNGQSWAEIGRISGTTNNAGSSLWESVAGVLRPLGHSLGTNQFTIAESTGWTGTGTNAFLDDGTFGAIASLNPTDGYVPYRFNAYSFEDSPLYRVDASTVAVMHDSTNSIELIGGNVGEIWFHGPVGSPSIIKSDTELYYDLEGNGSRFRMGNLLFTPLTTSQASLGAAATPWQWTYTDSVGWGGHTASFDSAGGVNPEGVVTADPGSIWRNTSTGSVWKKSTGTGDTGWTEFASGSVTTINPTDNYIPFRTNSTTFLNSPLYVTGTNVAIDSQVIFGPGTTNVLYRSDSNLIYTNGATTVNGVNFQVINGNGVRAMFGVDQDAQPFIRSDSGKVFKVEPNNGGPVYTFSSTALYPSGLSDLGTSATNFQWSSLYLSNQIVWGPGITNVLYRSGTDLIYTNRNASGTAIQISSDGTHFARYGVNGTVASIAGPTSGSVYIKANPSASDIVVTSSSLEPSSEVLALGSNSSNGAWTNQYFKGTLYQQGMNDGGGNYSRIAISHSGTNGAAIYNSQSAGTAGSPRNQVFQLGGTNQFSIGDGWIQLMRGMTKAEKATITPTNGMVVYQTDNTPGFRGYVNGSWVIFSTAADP